jgi:hypothetical protein
MFEKVKKEKEGKRRSEDEIIKMKNILELVISLGFKKGI